MRVRSALFNQLPFPPSDWTASMQLIPLLQLNNAKSRGIKLPKSLVHLVTCQLNVLQLDDTGTQYTTVNIPTACNRRLTTHSE